MLRRSGSTQVISKEINVCIDAHCIWGVCTGGWGFMLRKWTYSWLLGTELIMAAEGPRLPGGPQWRPSSGVSAGEGWGPTALDTRLVFQDPRGRAPEPAWSSAAQGSREFPKAPGGLDLQRQWGPWLTPLPEPHYLEPLSVREPVDRPLVPHSLQPLRLPAGPRAEARGRPA